MCILMYEHLVHLVDVEAFVGKDTMYKSTLILKSPPLYEGMEFGQWVHMVNGFTYNFLVFSQCLKLVARATYA